MTIHNNLKRLSLIGGSLTIVSVMAAANIASAATPASTAGSGSTSSSSSTSQHLQTIINKGNQEIARRLNNLNAALSKINSAANLSSSDQSALTSEVNNEISGLNTLKTQLDGSTTVSAAVSAAQSIVTEYRVYALVLPQVYLVKTADDQLATETKLSTFASNLQTRINSDTKANKATLQADLNQMLSDISSAQTISNNIDSSVINLQPSDYNSNHSVLSGDNSQLKTARNDEQSALNEGKTIVQSFVS